MYLAIALARWPDEHRAWHLLSVAETQRRHHADALNAIKRALVLASNEMAYQMQHGFTLVNLRRFKEAVVALLPLMRASPDDYPIMRALQVAYHYSGNEAHAVALGRKLLKAEEVNAMKIARESPSVDLMQFARGSDRVISFALPDANPAVAIGAVANAKLAQSIYPGWKCRLYVAQSVPNTIKSALRAQGADVIEASEQHADVPPALWGCLAADDISVGVFLCRSCTSRLSAKDADATNDWLNSGKRAHVMRDHVLHRNLVLPGMWGARTDHPLFVSARVDRFMHAYGNPPRGREQRFLDCEIWPAICDDCLIHDSYYDLFGAQRFPVMGKGSDRFHVGMGVTGDAILRKEAESLGLPWPLV